MMKNVGSMKATNVRPSSDGLILIKPKLEDFDLNLNNHIFGMVTDGGNLMKKTRRCLK